MAFLNGESKEDKKERKAQALLARYGLEDLKDDRDYNTVQEIAYDLMGNKIIQLGAALQGNSADAAKMSYLHAILETNFIMIRQLDRIAEELKKS